MKTPACTYTVGKVARLAHVSVRALRHYDELGLLRPSRRTEAGYRLYTSEDLERLQQVLFYKELGFTTDQIAFYNKFLGGISTAVFSMLGALRSASRPCSP